MDQQPQQSQQLNEELKKELFEKGNKKPKNDSSDTKSKNWVVQLFKDFFYICFGWGISIIWDFLKIFKPNKKANKQRQPVHIITENKLQKNTSSNNNTSISNSNTESKTISNNTNQWEQVGGPSVALCNDHFHDHNQTTVKNSPLLHNS